MRRSQRGLISAVIFGIFIFCFGCSEPAPVSNAPAPQTNVNVQVTSRAADGLDLQALGTILKTVRTGQELEQVLNRPGSINNLDLDQDGKTDYIRVIEKGQANARLFSLTAVLGNGEEQEVATVQFEKDSPQTASVQVQGNSQIYGDNVYYHSQVSLTDLILLNYLFAPRYVPYVSPWHYGYYPGYYSVYAPVPFATYRTVTHTYVQTSTLKPATTSQTKTAIQSPNAGKTAASIRAPLTNPTVSQKAFQERDTLKPVASGGFGQPKTGTPVPAAAAPKAASSPAPTPAPRATTPAPAPPRPSPPRSSGFGRRRK